MNALAKPLVGHVETLTATVDRECAVAWVYLSALAAWAEDHDLVDAKLRAGALPDRAKHCKANGTAVQWLRAAISALAAHPGTACLTDARYTRYREGEPTEEQALALLDWWAHEAPPLAYEVEEGPATISGFEIGDLRQAFLDEDTQRRDGVVYTPWQVVNFQMALKLAAVEKHLPGQGVLIVDPFCGTGHYPVRAIEHLWNWYTAKGLAPDRIFDVVSTTVSGCELDPFSAAVARLRVVAITGHLAQQSGLCDSRRLDAIPRWTPQIAVGNTFLAGFVTADEYATQCPELAAICNLGVPNIQWEAPWMDNLNTMEPVS
jgi:hypothetical protein